MDLGEKLLPDGLDASGDAGLRLGEELYCAELEGAEHTPAVRAGGENDDGRRPLLHEPPEEREAVHIRHLKIEGYHVGQKAECFCNGIDAVGGAADDLD